ncbi:MAG: 3-hydroxyacyl-CoA dehydrogenase family protein [Mogibacterium sp.]|nr:3-hydroxyacyl-CoA dehydrogenase family protein [Mogibacterium sp.]
MNIQTVTVIGATGTMGANVAGIFASFGNAKVFCVGRDIEKVRNTIPRIIASVRADSIADNLVPADYTMLDKCVRESDLIFESTSENIQVKKEIARLVSQSINEHAITCTGTSGLSIHEISRCYPEEVRKRFFGVHMFNPPYSLSLCELISTEATSETVKNELREYLEKKLLRTVVEVKDSPAFLGNRIGFMFINEAMQYAEKYKDSGGIDYIDAILGSFSGRSMPPLLTADFVGLDVHKAIVDNIHNNTDDYANDSFTLPEFVQTLIDNGALGRKKGEGLYKTFYYENGLKRKTVLDLNSEVYRDKIKYVFPFSERMKRHISEGDYMLAFEALINNHSQEAEICLSFLLKFIIYAVYAADKIGDGIDAADDVMAAGFNWCPPLALYEALSQVADVRDLIRERTELYSVVDVDRLLEKMVPSKYDFRKFFKTGRQ